MKNLKHFAIVLAVLTYSLAFITCGGDDPDVYDPVVYISSDDTNNYKLEITKNISKALTFTPGLGDEFVMTITLKIDGSLVGKSVGKVQSNDGGKLDLKPDNGAEFTVTVNASEGMTKIEGSIATDKGVVSVPTGDLTPEEVPVNPPAVTPNPANPLANTTWEWVGQTRAEFAEYICNEWFLNSFSVNELEQMLADSGMPEKKWYETVVFTDTRWEYSDGSYQVVDSYPSDDGWLFSIELKVGEYESGTYTVSGNSVRLDNDRPPDGVLEMHYSWTFSGNTLIAGTARTFIKQ